MLLYLLSKPDGWKFYEDDLVKRSSNGKTSVRSIIKELLEVGYLIRGERFRDEKGHLKGYSYIVEPYLLDDYDGVSYFTFSKVGKSNLGNPYLGKSQRSNTNLSSNTQLTSNTQEEEDNMSGKPDAPSIPYQNIISYLNQKANTKYRHTSKNTQKLIKARFNEGFTEQDFFTVIDKKVATWLNDNKMSQYLRPETLFGTKFESYLNEHVKTPRNDYMKEAYPDLPF